MPVLGRERFAEDVAIAAGGGAYITAAHLSSLGRPAALLTRLGTDSLSHSLDSELEASGIDLSFIERSDDAGPQPTVALNKDGERAFVSRRAGASRPATLERALSAPDIAHLHIAEFATLRDNPDVIALARDRGLTISLDPSWDDQLIRRDTDFFRTCAGIDVFLPNVEEGAALTGEASDEAILRRLNESFPLVVLKRGERGAMASLNRPMPRQTPAPSRWSIRQVPAMRSTPVFSIRGSARPISNRVWQRASRQDPSPFNRQAALRRGDAIDPFWMNDAVTGG